MGKSINKSPDFRHFIPLDGRNYIFFRLIVTAKLFIFYFGRCLLPLKFGHHPKKCMVLQLDLDLQIPMHRTVLKKLVLWKIQLPLNLLQRCSCQWAVTKWPTMAHAFAKIFGSLLTSLLFSLALTTSCSVCAKHGHHIHPSIHVYLHQEKSHNCKQDREAGQKGQRTTLTTALKPN